MYKISVEDLPTIEVAESGFRRQTFPDHLGSGYTDTRVIDQGLSFIHTRLEVNNHISVLSSNSSEEPRLIVTIGLEGRSRFVAHGEDAELEFSTAYTTIVASYQTTGERQYHADERVHQIRLSMTGAWIQRHLGDELHHRFFDRGNTQLLSYQPTGGQGLILAKKLPDLNPADPLNKLAFQAQALAVIASELSHFGKPSDNPLALSERDMRLAQAVRTIITNEYRNPPTLSELARRIGTNQQKMVRLCQNLFGRTPHELLTDIRMETARQLLESALSVTEVADRVGYSHVSTFSAAFSQHFGISPKTLRKRLHLV